MLIVLYSAAIDTSCALTKSTVMRLLGTGTYISHVLILRALLLTKYLSRVTGFSRFWHFLVIWKGGPHLLVACQFGQDAAITG
jgi:hypothetical protein